MKLYLYVLAIFANLTLLTAVLAVGDYVLSALGAILRADWDTTYTLIVALYSVPILLGFITMFVAGKLLPWLRLRTLLGASGAAIVAGMCGMFVSVLIPVTQVQIGVFTAARVVYVCGLYPMSVQVDYIMWRCFHYYTGYKEIHRESWLLPVSFVVMGVTQTYSEDFGKMVADVLLPYLSTLSLQIALSTMLALAALVTGSVLLTNWLYERMQKTLIAQKIDGETDAQGTPLRPVNFAKFFREEYAVGYLKALGLLAALTFVWTGIRNGFLLLMPGIWMDLFDLSAVVAPAYVGYGLLASCALGAIFCLLPTSIGALRVFFVVYCALMVPGCAGMLFSAYYPFPLLTAVAVCSAGSLTIFVIMLFIPLLFRESDYVMVFVWLEIARGLANITVPLFFGLLFENEMGTTAVVLTYMALSALGLAIFLVAYFLLEHNRRYAASFDKPAVVSNTQNAGATQYPDAVGRLSASDLDTSFSESEFLPDGP